MDNSETRIIKALNAGLSELRAEMHAGFNRLDNRIEQLEDLQKSNMAEVKLRFGAIDQQFEAIDERFGAVDQQFLTINQRFDRLENEMRLGFAKQEKLSHDVIETMVQSSHSYSIYVDNEFKQDRAHISNIQSFLCSEFPDRYKPLSPS